MPLSNHSSEDQNSFELLVPPRGDLAKRVGGTIGRKFIAQGADIKKCLQHCLPETFSFAGKRVLDFGCGVGRVLRHFSSEAKGGHFYGCDIHEPSVEYLAKDFPYFHLFKNDDLPPLPFLSRYFDLIICVSVFTHLVDSWSEWLKELHRILKPNGLFLASYLYRTAYEKGLGKSFSEEENGFSVFFRDRPWQQGGPNVYHSNWWILENWGKTFRIDYIFEEGLLNWQSVALMRKVEGDVSILNQKPQVVRPYLYMSRIKDFEGNIAYNKFPGHPWYISHGIHCVDRCEINGWFISKKGPIVRIIFQIDKIRVNPESIKSIQRKDVHAKFPDYLDSLNSGFSARINLKDIPTGQHELRVIAKDAEGRSKELAATLWKCEELAESKPFG